MTLGKLVALYRVTRAYDDVGTALGHKLQYFNVSALEPLVDIRNRVTHEGHKPDPAETAWIVCQVELILRETGRLPAAAADEAATGALPPWWQVTIPHRDIREGKLDLKVFAVNLAQVIEGQAVPEYRDPETFFRRTYVTRGLAATLRGVLRRLAGQPDGTSITQLATVFGGGKTHTLLALYHTVQSGARLDHVATIRDILRDADLDAIPVASVASVDCAHISPSQPRTTPEGLTLRTLWGEVAYRLGGATLYEHVRDSDEQCVAPGSEVLEAMFAAAGPSLILLDETLSYITKASGIKVGGGYLSDQALEFLLELTRAVSATDHVALVLTMTSSEQEQIGEAAVAAAQEVDTAIRILKRTRQMEVSAEREEIYEILKRRLFDSEVSLLESHARGAAKSYWDYYRRHATDFPQDAQTPEFRDLMIRSYPFHPQLIEVLRDRWGTIPSFQRTRGVLRMLALVIGDLYRREHRAPIIQTAHVNLDAGDIRAELLEYVGNPAGYESAIFSDIGGTAESKAPSLDQLAAGDYQKYRIATGLATAVFMFSHSGAVERRAAAERPDLWLATLRPDIVPALAADALEKLRQQLWYLAVHEGSYRVDNQPNLNQMLVSRMDATQQDDAAIRERLRATVEELVGRRVFPHSELWPGDPSAIASRPSLTFVVVDPEHTWGADEAGQVATRAYLGQLLESAGNTFRKYKNSLVFAVCNPQGRRQMEQQAVRVLALESIHRQYRDGGLSETQVRELHEMLERERKGLPAVVWGAYSVIVAPNGTMDGGTSLWVRVEHGAGAFRPGEHSLAARAHQRLVDEQRLLTRLDPRLLAEGKPGQWLVWPPDEDRIRVEQLWDRFGQYPYLPMLTGPEALQSTIGWGVERGLFAYALGNGREFDTIHHPHSSVPAQDFAAFEGAWLLRPAAATAYQSKPHRPAPEPGTTVVPRPRPEPAVVDVPPQPPVPSHVYHHVTIDTPLDWRDWYDFYREVIHPLAESALRMTIAVHVSAEGDLDANLVDLSIRESVLQRSPGAKVDAE